MKRHTNKQESASRKQAYVAPRATCVPVQAKRGYGCCNFTTPALCGYTSW